MWRHLESVLEEPVEVIWGDAGFTRDLVERQWRAIGIAHELAGTAEAHR